MKSLNERGSRTHPLIMAEYMSECAKICGRGFVRWGSPELFELANWFLADARRWRQEAKKHGK